MSYVTNADIESRLGTEAYIALTDDAGNGTADPARINEARMGAEGEANSYLATRYKTPVDVSSEPEVESVLRCFVLDLVAYRLHSRRPPVPEDIVRRREEAVTWLSRVASGVVQLPAIMAPAQASSLGIVGERTPPSRRMTRKTLENL